jgi:hypothetical protein
MIPAPAPLYGPRRSPGEEVVAAALAESNPALRRPTEKSRCFIDPKKEHLALAVKVEAEIGYPLLTLFLGDVRIAFVPLEPGEKPCLPGGGRAEGRGDGSGRGLGSRGRRWDRQRRRRCGLSPLYRAPLHWAPLYWAPLHWAPFDRPDFRLRFYRLRDRQGDRWVCCRA